MESVENQFADLVDQLAGEEGVTVPDDVPGAERRFGSAALKVDNRIFAMLSGDRLVVKLPRKRVDELVDAGAGDRFDPRKDGRLMKEWLVLDPSSDLEWLALAKEALAFVGARR